MTLVYRNAVGLAVVGVLASIVACSSNPFVPEAGPSATEVGDTTPTSPPAATPTTDGGSKPALIEAVSGSRLKAHSFTTDEGASVFDTWFDDKLGTPCKFGVGPDGVMRCFPSNTLEYIVPTYPRRDLPPVFANDACTAPALVASTTEKLAFASATDTVGCRVSGATAYRFFPLGAALTKRFVKSGSMCVPAVSTTGPTYPVGAELALTAFVEAEITRQPAVSGVVPIVLRTSDGASGLYGFENAATMKACVFERMRDGREHCVPASVVLLGNWSFADARCTLPGGAVLEEGCESTSLGVFRDNSCLGVETQLYTVGTSSVSWSASSGACGADTTVPPANVLDAVSELLPETLPVATEVSLGAGRLTPLARGFDGVAVTTDRFTDTVRKETCRFVSTDEGPVRCIPDSPAFAEGWFANPDCTEPVAEAFGCTETPVFAWSGHFAGLDATMVVEKVYRVLSPLVPPSMLYGWTTIPTNPPQTQCVAGRPPNTGSSVFAIGDEIPLTAFVDAKPVVR